ncbi:MAG TPA: zinc ribbon domain-containing protein [Thermoanaerobaculia bacterium]|nr:zinc ribbon domain-containing protein [Thermoanaerobaculia bacterium]
MVEAVAATNTTATCPECGAARPDPSRVCPACGAPPMRAGDKRAVENEVRTEDLEPYVALRYIARLFKVLAVLLVVMLLGEVITGLIKDGAQSLMTLLGEATRMLVQAGFLWAAGDITILVIDAGHDLRVARILLGRINAAMHEREQREKNR